MGNLAGLSRINSPSGRGRDALGILLEESPFLRFLESNSGWELGATKFQWQPEDVSEKTIAARAIGAGAQSVAQDIAITDLEADILAAYNANFDIDASYLADVDRKLANMDEYMLKELRRRIRYLAIYLEKEMFQGTGQSNRMAGLAVILDGSDLPGYDGITRVENAQDVTGGSTTSCDLTVRTNDNAFIEFLGIMLAKVNNPQGIICSPQAAARLDTIARVNYMAGETRDLFGRPVRTYAGIPIVPVLATTITNDEDDDDYPSVNEDTTSLYIPSLGEQRLSVVTNSGLEYVDFDLQEGKQSNREKVEIRGKWKIETPEAILRIRNIKV
jgi:hypothetical protein